MIKDSTTGRVLAKDAKICRSVFSKALGLMFRFRLKDKGYVFLFRKEQRVDLHMLFVFFPIDVVFLDKDKKVVEIKQEFRPFTVYVSKKKAMYVVELPKGTSKGVKLGHKLTIS